MAFVQAEMSQVWKSVVSPEEMADGRIFCYMGRRGSAGAWVEGAGVCEGSKSCIIGLVARLKKMLKTLKDCMGFQCMLSWGSDGTYEY